MYGTREVDSQRTPTNRRGVIEGHSRNSAAVLLLHFDQSKPGNRRLDVQQNRRPAHALSAHAQVTTLNPGRAGAALAHYRFPPARGCWVKPEVVRVRQVDMCQ